ncbi:hypothetical protein [Actinomadura hibisca]|uniref:hypothetical protein n=1 Tax=Actinomadura hibisca TaxID=68565 RepID=UPI0008331575|nr:hypothetical protein [Actinomadura hibisca]
MRHQQGLVRFEIEFPPATELGTALELREALLKAGADAAEPLRVRQPCSSRTRPGEIVDIAGLAVAFVGTVAAVVDVLRGWLAERRDDAGGGMVTIKVVIDGDPVEITYPATGREDRMVRDFILRHNGNGNTNGGGGAGTGA